MRRRSGWRVGLVACTATLAACAGTQRTTSKAIEIDPSWLARVPSENMAPVEEARAARRAQEDELTRVSVARKDAENQVDVAKNEEKAAKAAIDAAEARVEGAKSRGQYTEINEAKAALDRAKLTRKVAEAKKERDQKAVDLAKAQENLAKARLDTATTHVSQAEYRALLATGDTRAAKLDPAAFDQAISGNLVQEHKAQAEVDRRQQGLLTASATYDRLNQQLRASQSSPPAG